ncbi:DNA topoisomerase IB [Roseobacteraceae bacterium NS-SX3]
MKLVYRSDDTPGITRRRRGRGFSYHAPDGTHIADRREVARLKALAVPPAYTDVWMSPLANGHLQATGRDARRRKQYRYHPDWQAWRAQRKFDQLAQFGESLPGLRRWIMDRLGRGAGSEEAAVAAVLALLDRASMRIGSPAYAAENRTYGALTLRARHVDFDGNAIQLSYTAKGGRRVQEEVRSTALQRVLERCQDLPGPELISWTGPDGAARAVRSEQVQEVLAAVCGDGVSAKTLRTWNGTHAAFVHAMDTPDLTIKGMAEAAADRLHNTPAIARNSYIHPDVTGLATMEAAQRARRLAGLEAAARDGFRAGEAALLAFLGE